MNTTTLVCRECGNTTTGQPLASDPSTEITCRKTHLHKSKRPVEMEEAK